MKYKIRLPIKSSAAAFDDIQEIRKRNSYSVEGKFQYVDFNEVTDDMETLFSVSRELTTFKFYFNDREVQRSNLMPVKNSLFCSERKICDGICTHYAIRDVDNRFKRISLQEVKGVINPEYSFEVSDWKLDEVLKAGMKERRLEFVQSETMDTQYFKKDIFIKNFKEGLKSEQTYCPIIKWEKIQNYIEKIPSQT